jgi:hypothetical protein
VRIRRQHIVQMAKDVSWEVTSMVQFYSRIDKDEVTDRELAAMIVDRVKLVLDPLLSDPSKS